MARFICEQLESRRLMSLSVFHVPTRVTTTTFAPGPKDSVWTSDADGPHIYRMTDTGRVRTITLRSPCRPTGLTEAPDGDMWFVDNGGNFDKQYVGRVTPSGHVREYPVPGQLQADSLVVGPDGNLWFLANVPTSFSTFYQYNKPTVFSVSPKGVFHRYSVADSYSPAIMNGLAVGSDGVFSFDVLPQLPPLGILLVEFDLGGNVLSVGSQSNAGVSAVDGNHYTTVPGGIALVNADSSTTLVAPSSLPIDNLFAGPFQKLWFHDTNGDIGYMNADGTLTLDNPPDNKPVRQFQPATGTNVIFFLEGDQVVRYDVETPA